MKVISLLLVLLLSSCASYINKLELVERLNIRAEKDQGHINILWYAGTKNEFHYLVHVYEMFGTKKYKISINELIIEDSFPLTSDSQKWMRISSISNDWLASRRSFETKQWLREDEGLHL